MSRIALRLLTDKDTTVLADRSYPRPQMATYPTCGGGLNLPRLFEAGISWSPIGDTIVVSYTPAYEFDEMRAGKLIRRVRRALDPRPATDAMAIAEAGDGFQIDFGRGVCTVPPREVVNGRGYAPTVPWIADLVRRPGGEVWVQKKEVGAENDGPVDVFDSSGAYLGTLAPDFPFPILFLDRDRLVVAETDDFDITRLTVYRVHEN